MVLGNAANWVMRVFIVVVALQLRSAVRARYAIQGDGCGDCCAAFWCLPCVLTQLQAQIWKAPSAVPGCAFDASPASLA
jgi:Cys-rich protein (TIGR01571 family)